MSEHLIRGFIVFWFAAMLSAQPALLTTVVKGRSPLESPKLTDGTIETAAFVGDVVHVIITVHGMTSDASGCMGDLRWLVTTLDGDSTSATLTRVDATESSREFRAGPDADSTAKFVLSALPPGIYHLQASCASDETVVTGDRRRLIVYAGDENPTINRAFLVDRAKVAIGMATRDGYMQARAMLLKAANGNTDPSIYELLADASAPWADPRETAGYYERSLAVARANLARKFGEPAQWPAAASTQFRRRERKVEVFRALVPELVANFAERRVVVKTEGSSQMFVIERRKDGVQLRAIDAHR